ncbi:MAG: PAS domain-containing protein [Bacteroidetes bacterium]|nr:PAS domain-containing protein [Bacteroidota bacterium]
MKRVSLFRWIKNVSIAKKLYFTVGIMAILIAIELGVLIFSVNTLSSVRAYVTGEGLWSKAQKEAVYQLMKYGRTHDEADYEKFREFMKVSEGDHKTLVELGKENPDLEAAKQGFIEGRNHPDDVEGMINLFRRFHFVSYISKAIIAWSKADSLVRKFDGISKKLHTEINKTNPSQDSVNHILAEIDPINTNLTFFEDEFSYTLGEGSRWLEYVILRLLFGVALTVECTGLLLAITVSRGIQRGLKEILLSAQAVAKRDFSRKAKVFSKDEIGILANNFNMMSDELERSIHEIENVQQRFKNLLESAPDAIVILNDSGVIQIVNAQTENMFGYSRSEILGKEIDLLITCITKKKNGNGSFHHVLDIMQNNEPEELEWMGIRKDEKEFPVEISFRPIRMEEGLLISAAIRNITEKKLLEKQIMEININLEKKVTLRTNELERKNKELEQFAYVASHDLQEPLRTTTGFAELIRQKYLGKIDADADKYISYIIQSSDRMKTLIKDLLDYSRIGRETQAKKINCNELLCEVLADLDGLIKESHAEINATELPTILGYPTEIKQLFQNLISNAIKFRQKDIAPRIKIAAEKNEQHWLFSFSDNGIGIEEKYLSRIFVIFQRLHTRTEYEGSGIGLANCKKIAELHNGRIWAESEPGKGSTFYCSIHEFEHA